MSFAIFVTFRGPTNKRGPRLLVKCWGFPSKSYPYTHCPSDTGGVRYYNNLAYHAAERYADDVMKTDATVNQYGADTSMTTRVYLAR